MLLLLNAPMQSEVRLIVVDNSSGNWTFKGTPMPQIENAFQQAGFTATVVADQKVKAVVKFEIHGGQIPKVFNN